MTIKRTINGIELRIELTNQEMMEARDHMDHFDDVFTIKELASDYDADISDEEVENIANNARDGIFNSDTIMDCEWRIYHEAIEEWFADKRRNHNGKR